MNPLLIGRTPLSFAALRISLPVFTTGVIEAKVFPLSITFVHTPGELASLAPWPSTLVSEWARIATASSLIGNAFTGEVQKARLQNA